MSNLKCLSVLQPWAWAIIHGKKRIENRTWRTDYRGKLLIHTGKSRRTLDSLTMEEWQMEIPEIDPSPNFWMKSPFGKIIGQVDLVDCVPIQKVMFEPYAVGPYCWILENPKAIEPIEFKGNTKLFEVPIDLLQDAELLRRFEI